jgi:signal peptidase II
VVDFLDLHFGEWRPFLIFNVGDAAISIAVVILLLRAFLTRKDRAEGQGPQGDIEHA